MSDQRTISIGELVRACRTAFWAAGVFSFFVNSLMLTAPLFMFQVFDRVLSSRNEATLYLLLAMAASALAVQAALDMVRGFAFVRVSIWIDRRVSPILLSSVILGALDRGRAPDSGALRSLATLRGFLTGPGMLTLLDLPWAPVFLGVIWLVNPAMGVAAIVGAVMMFLLGVMNDLLTRKALTEAQGLAGTALRQAEAAMRNAAVVQSMGMRGNVLQRWRTGNEAVLRLQSRASDRAATVQAISKAMRMLVQLMIMTVGVLQILDPRIGMTPGAMIAVVVILGRALQPVEMAISQARQLIDSIGAYRGVRSALSAAPQEGRRTELPPPTGQITVEDLGFQPDAAARPILARIGFELRPGESLGVVGPLAAGKSTLARLLVGVERPSTGAVRYDGADITGWDADRLGRFIGYMPQDVQLFAGTVAENIARLAVEPDAAAVIRAAETAGVHEAVLHLPAGYDTQIGEAGAILSGGQRQRIALARALYGEPRMLVLDEPAANLDQAGEAALLAALAAMRQRGVTIVLVSHKQRLLQTMDKLLLLRAGSVERFGPRSDFMRREGGSGEAPAGPGAGVHTISTGPAPVRASLVPVARTRPAPPEPDRGDGPPGGAGIDKAS